MSGPMGLFAAIATAVIGLAIIAVLVSRGSQTSSVIQAASTGFGTIIGAAVGPVTGGGLGSNVGSGGLLSNSGGIYL